VFCDNGPVFVSDHPPLSPLSRPPPLAPQPPPKKPRGEDAGKARASLDSDRLARKKLRERGGWGHRERHWVLVGSGALPVL
jgi:hypothetical protein